MMNNPFRADQIKAPVTLSVCLIVKDEARVLGRCLSAAVQFADELIVLDTGSKDRSREIAGEYTDLVFSEPWQNSFAKARNFAASKARCDYVMWLDADDVMHPGEIRKLIALKARLTPETDVVFTTYRNYGFLSDMGLRYTYGNMTRNEWSFSFSIVLRISSFSIHSTGKATISFKPAFGKIASKDETLWTWIIKGFCTDSDPSV